MKFLVFFFLFLVLYSSSSYGQPTLGFSEGVGLGKFYNYSQHDDYEANYPWKYGNACSFFIELPEDSLRIESVYVHQESELTVNYDAGKSSYYQKHEFKTDQIVLIFSYRLPIVKILKTEIFWGVGPLFSLTLKSENKSSGWEYRYATQTDSAGVNNPTVSSQNWTENENNSAMLSKYDFGAATDIECVIPLRHSLHLLIQSKSMFFLSNRITKSKFRYTSSLFSSLNIGLMYKILNH